MKILQKSSNEDNLHTHIEDINSNIDLILIYNISRRCYETIPDTHFIKNF